MKDDPDKNVTLLVTNRDEIVHDFKIKKMKILYEVAGRRTK